MMVGASTSIRCLYPCPKACLPMALFNCQYGFVQPISISATSQKTSVLPTLFLVVTNLVENQSAGKKLGTDTPQNQFCAKQEMCYFSAVKFGIPAAKIRPQIELATYCKCIIPTATSRRNFRRRPWEFNPEIIATATERQLRLLGKHPESTYG